MVCAGWHHRRDRGLQGSGERRGGKAFGLAVLGGIAVIAAFGFLALAVIFGLLWKPPVIVWGRVVWSSPQGGGTRIRWYTRRSGPHRPRGLGRTLSRWRSRVQRQGTSRSVVGRRSPPGPVGNVGRVGHPAAYICGVEIQGRSHHDDRVRQRLDPLRRLQRDHLGRAVGLNILDTVSTEAPVGWTDSPTINPGPFQFPATRPRPALDGPARLLVLPQGQVREIHAARPAAAGSAAWVCGLNVSIATSTSSCRPSDQATHHGSGAAPQTAARPSARSSTRRPRGGCILRVTSRRSRT